MIFLSRGICAMLLLCAATLAQAAAINMNDFDVYYGDFNGDGLSSDIYFHGKEKFVIIAGDIAIPILIKGEPGFVYYENTDKSYSAGVSLNKSQAEMVSFVKAESSDVTLGDVNGDSIADLVIRGKADTSSALVINGNKTGVSADVIKTIRNDGASKTLSGSWSAANSLLANISNRGNAITITSGVINVAPMMVSLRGTVSYQRIPYVANPGAGRDYQNIQTLPVRGVVVNLVNGSGAVIDRTICDLNGRYFFSVAARTSVRVQVVAELLSPTGNASWDVQVRNHQTPSETFSSLGSLADTGTLTTQTRDIQFNAGWTPNGEPIAGQRAAAPFAILDSIFDSIQLLVTADPNIQLDGGKNSAGNRIDPVLVEWAENFDVVSNYNGGSFIYLAGAPVDPDEYDRGVVQHEFGHFVDKELTSRGDSLGGNHNLDSRLDLRLAWGEAWGTAFAGMSANDPVYRDAKQTSEFFINVENNNIANSTANNTLGWYSEGTVGALIWDLFDGQSDSAQDNIALGIGPIYRALISPSFKNSDAFISIYNLLDVLKAQNPSQVTAITNLSNLFSIFGTGIFGDNETNNANLANQLPIYTRLTLGQNINLCTTAWNSGNTSNRLGAHRFVHITVPSSGNYAIRVTPPAGASVGFKLFRAGVWVADSTKMTSSEVANISRQFNAGVYVIDVGNALLANSNLNLPACNAVTLTTN